VPINKNVIVQNNTGLLCRSRNWNEMATSPYYHILVLQVKREQGASNNIQGDFHKPSSAAAASHTRFTRSLLKFNAKSPSMELRCG